MSLEGGTGGVLVLHDGCEHKGGDEGNGERVGHRFVVLVEGVLKDVQSQTHIEVFEEDASQVVALRNNDGVLGTQLVQVGKRRAEHGVGGDVAEAALFIELFQSGLHGSDVAQYTVFRQQRQYLTEGIQCVLYRGSIDDQLGAELCNLFQRGETVGVVHEA